MYKASALLEVLREFSKTLARSVGRVDANSANKKLSSFGCCLAL
jgi:hypothetical protein